MMRVDRWGRMAKKQFRLAINQVEHKCAVCGTTFLSTSRNADWCGSTCRMVAKAARAAKTAEAAAK
jgi:hypothetical protein